MSALGGIFTSLLLVVVAMLSVGLLMGSMILGYKFLQENLAEVSLELTRSKGSLEVLNLTVIDNDKAVKAFVLNRGAGSIKASNFKKMDLLLIYWSAKSRSIKASWIPYDVGCVLGQGPCWSAINVTYQGGSEILNPVSQDFSSGMWDSGEVLEIIVKLAASERIDSSKPAALIIAAPNGVKTP